MTSDHPVKSRKKLIEVAIPLEAINAASAYEKLPGIGPHPRGIHLWWARRPLATARAILFSQLVDDPSSCPEDFPDEESQETERLRLHHIISKLVEWRSVDDAKLYEEAYAEIVKSWNRCREDNRDHPSYGELFQSSTPPQVLDPFAGGGAIPIEAKRLNLTSIASDLNPIAVLINSTCIDYPFRFHIDYPISQLSRGDSSRGVQSSLEIKSSSLKCIADDVRHYGDILLDRVKTKVSQSYGIVAIDKDDIGETEEMNRGLERYLGRRLNVVAWLWARTVESPNPFFKGNHVPLVASWSIAKKKGRDVYIEPIVNAEDHSVTYKVRAGLPRENYPTVGRRGGKCLLSGDPISLQYIRQQGRSSLLKRDLIAVVAEGDRERVYLDPREDRIPDIGKEIVPWFPDLEINHHPRDIKTQTYGIVRYGDMFTDCQLSLLTGLSDSLAEIEQDIYRDAIKSGLVDDCQTLESGGSGALAYTKLIMTYLAFAIDRVADFSNTCTRWVKGNEKVMNLFGKQAIAMTWDFPEAASLNEVVGGFKPAVQFISDCILKLPEWGPRGTCSQMDAKATSFNQGLIVSTDPPYYDNIGYADLSDFFYVWLRRSLKSSYPRLLSTLSVPKKDELVATPYRHGSMENAESFFLNGMKEAMRQISLSSHPSYPVTLYYAFKQAETSNSDGETRTGWEAFLQSVIESGLQIVGTWPVRSEQEHRMIGIGKNALASCVVLVCRQRPAVAKIVSRAQFRRQLKEDLPDSIRSLEKCNIAPVDVSQAAIGPGMAIFSEAKAVLNSDDSAMTVREALVEINAALDEYLSQDEGEMDADTRFALTFYESFGYEERDYGDAESLAMARNISVDGVAKAGILRSLAGKVRLLHRSELPSEWDPATDKRLCVWEATQQLINYLESKGESEAAALLKKLKDIHGHGDLPSSCRALAYRLYNHCEKAKQAEEARSYNGLVIAWPELERLASAAANAQSAPHQPSLI